MRSVLWPLGRAFPLKGLVNTKLHLLEHSKDLPWWVVLRPVAWDLANRCPDCDVQIAELLWVVHLGLASWARCCGLLRLVYAPRELGGFGLMGAWHH